MQFTVHRAGEDRKLSRGPVRLRVNASDKALTPENRQAEIAILSLGCGHIAFDLVMKAEQLLQTFALNDQVIKGRQKAHWRGRWRRVQRHSQSLLQVVWLHKINLR